MKRTLGSLALMTGLAFSGVAAADGPAEPFLSDIRQLTTGEQFDAAGEALRQAVIADRLWDEWP